VGQGCPLFFTPFFPFLLFLLLLYLRISSKFFFFQNLSLGVLEQQTGITEENINIPSSTGQGKKRPAIEILEESNSDVSDSEESEDESDSNNVEMSENEEKSAT
jgi:hypothetical protein